MVPAKLNQLIRDGEGLAVEFKRCENKLVNGVYETVSAFSNRYGGHIILGVEDSGEICGVNSGAVPGIKKNFINTLNNPERFAPTQFLALEETVIGGKTVLWCFVPPSSQVVMFGGRIYDRAEDGDIDITRNSEMVTHLHRRKSADYSERKIYPYAKDDDFDFARLMPKVRRLATNRLADHPWANMSDAEILKSAGLYQEDRETGKCGYNLAAILLLGRDEVIRSCTTNYLTDAICRREDLNRYDDRLMVTTNLIDAYDLLIEFIAKHTLDRFFLIGGQSVSVRSSIARELVSNILVHRDYTSTYPAKIIIERGRIVTENWNLPKTPGRIDPQNFTPYPKNPLLAGFFTNIGRADILGSGVRNLYRFTKMYSGSEPELIESDIFKTIVPLGFSDNDTETGINTGIDTDNDTGASINTENNTDSDTGSNTGTDINTGIDTDNDTRTDINTEIDTGSDTETGINTENNTDSDTGSNTGTDINTGIDTDNDTGTDINTEIDTGSDTKTGINTENNTDSSVDREKISESQKMILKEIKKNPYITSEELAGIVGITPVNVRVNLSKLKAKGLIERIGPDRGGHWKEICRKNETSPKHRKRGI
jgi:ATP-dependent DNA helicase RecG